MCGRFFTNSSPQSHELFRILGIYDETEPRPNIAPTDPVKIVVQGKCERQIRTAHWWLAMKADTNSDKMVPDNRWQSFNTRSDKILTSPMHSIAPKSFRVVIPAAGYYEWQQTQAFALSIPDEDIAFGGLAKYWPQSGQFSCSIVTLPGHPALAHIHKKSVPLMLRGNAIDQWLDRGKTHADLASLWRKPSSFTLNALQIESLKNPVATAELERLELGYV